MLGADERDAHAPSPSALALGSADYPHDPNFRDYQNHNGPQPPTLSEHFPYLSSWSGPNAFMRTVAEERERFNVGGVQAVRNAYAPVVEVGLDELIGSPR